MSSPLILVTNDDGVSAPGIGALADALAPLGEVWVIAPDRERSACAQSLTLAEALRATLLRERVYAVDGTPADCVNLAVVKLLPRRPALVVSGINRGANLGEDVFYSGTVGGAREGVFFGVPAIAISLSTWGEIDYAPAAAFAARISARVLAQGLPERTLLNVNVPSGQPQGVAITRQGRRPQGLMLAEPGTDVYALRAGLVSVSPLGTDTTQHAALSRLQSVIE